MKEVQVTAFEAYDGKHFPSASACREYEASNLGQRLVGLSLEQVSAALVRTDIDLADAIEDAGRKIEKIRKEQGAYRRKRNGETADAQGEAA